MENSDMNSLCRACLKELLQNKYDIFLMPSLEKLFTICTSLVIDENDGCSKYLCENCYHKIQDFFEFREMCLKSFQKFEEIKHNLQTIIESTNSNINLEFSELDDNKNKNINHLKNEIQNKTLNDDFHSDFEDNQSGGDDDNEHKDFGFTSSSSSTEGEEEDDDDDKDSDYENNSKTKRKKLNKNKLLRNTRTRIQTKKESQKVETIIKTENQTKAKVPTSKPKKRERNKSPVIKEIFTCDTCGKRFF